jgi:1,5-anhydro-D-fructose reductase (1,5-anhydro-D-mannitol-forming)
MKCSLAEHTEYMHHHEKVDPMLHWLLVGIGDIATRRVIPAIQAEARSSLAAVVTRQPNKAVSYAVPAFPSLEAALHHGTFDAVYIATPVFLHTPQTMQALHAGKHVLCEKPMAMNYAEALTMVDAAQRTARCFGVAYYRRCYPKVQRALQLIRQGAIGAPLMAFATCHSQPPPEHRSWLLDPAQAGGGPLYDIASHRIDLLNYFFGQPVEVQACLSNVVHHFAVEDSATVLIKYASGVHAVVDVRWNSHLTRDEFRISGSHGTLDLTPLNEPGLISPAGEENLPPHSNLHFPCIANFVDAVLQQTPLLSSGVTALPTDWVTEQATKR